MVRARTNTTINGKDYYRIRRKVNGKVKSFYGTSKRDAERKYAEYVENASADGAEKPQTAITKTFSHWSRNYITNVLKPSQKYATATKERYIMAYETHIQGTWLDEMEISEIRSFDVQRFYNELPVSKQTLATINKYMISFCKWLVRTGCAENFLSAVEIPKKPENKRHEGIVVWEEDEIQTIIGSIQGHRLCLFVYVLLYTGARISEAIALEHGDIYDGSIHIVRQCYHGEIKEPKYGSARDIPMHMELEKAYREHVSWQQNEMAKNGYETDLLFTTSNGTMYDPVNLRRALKRFYASHGIEYKHPHAYRSTFCTQLCRCGVPIEVASSLMGHKSIEITAQHYALVKTDTKQDAIKMLRY